MNEILTCGYSAIAIILAIALGGILMLFLCMNECRRYRQGMPFAGISSAAISAACHRPEKDIDAAVLPVLWGSVETEGPIGHCCFTSFEVFPLVEGKSYAGQGARSTLSSVTASGLEKATRSVQTTGPRNVKLPKPVGKAEFALTTSPARAVLYQRFGH